MDNNYPPYVFLDGKGSLQGILIDQWRLWERKTGVEAVITGMDWGEALRRMERGEFDVIDTIFFNERRAGIYDFSKPYSKLDVSIFFNKDISGISNADSLQGFPVAVKSGDAAIDFLREKGISLFQEYPSYEAIIRAAKDQKVMVAVIDNPPALYFLYKMGILSQFRHSAPLYAGEFHRAVRKGNAAILKTVEDGFAHISEREYQDINRRWFGTEAIAFYKYLRSITIGLGALILVVLFLIAWNWTLRKKIREKTADLREEIALNIKKTEALQESEAQFHILSDNLPGGIVYQIDFGEDGQQRRFRYISAGVERLHGVKVVEALSDATTIYGQVVEEDRHLLAEREASALANMTPFSVEVRIRSVSGEIRWVLLASSPRRLSDNHLVWDGIEIDITSRKLAEEDSKQTLERLHKSLGGTIQAMAMMVETRDPYTAGHQKKVSNLARVIAQEMGLSKDMIDKIRMAGVIHDIGKLSVPAEILSKPTKLTDIEFSLIKVHPKSGYDILKDIDLPYPIAEIVYQHHERLDGSGYPQGLKDGQILIGSCILAVADTVEAMASHRPYRPGKGIDAAFEEIEKNKGIFYDAKVVDTCIRVFREKAFTFETTWP